MMRRSTWIVVAVLALAACTRSASSAAPTQPVIFCCPPSPSPRSAQDLLNTKWVLASIDGHQMSVHGLRRITLEFDSDRLGGFSGCNSYGARWTVQGPRLVLLGPIQATAMGCQARAAWADAKLFDVLTGSPFIRQGTADDRLVLSTRKGELEFTQQS